MYKLQKGINQRHYKGTIISPSFIAHVIGKVLDSEKIPFPQSYVKFAVKNGWVECIEGISIIKGESYLQQRFLTGSLPLYSKVKAKCNRCFTQKKEHFVEYDCKRCSKRCVYCRNCITMGRIATCTTLIKSSITSLIKKKDSWCFSYCLFFLPKHEMQWDGKLTDLQQTAADELLRSIQMNKNHLVHAVCGAGKTELMFPAILSALSQGKRVCIATPRTDVVLELTPRIQRAFPNTIIQSLYGGAEQLNQLAMLVISTTHQLLRFQNAFDVIIVDEADAFPYTFDEMLQRAVIKAKKKNAPQALITATPSNKMLQLTKSEKMNYSFIPKRYHDFPLPIPQKRPLWRYEKIFKKGEIPRGLKLWIQKHINHGRPLLIFFPSVQLVERVYPLFKETFEGFEKVHANDERRKEKVLELREKKLNALLTTTILERGITIENVQVAVVGAENEVFDSGALIQIAGRVGRSAKYPSGDVIFFHHGVTAQIDEAIMKIKNSNHIANFNKHKGEYV